MNFFVHLLMAHSIRKNVQKTTGHRLHLAGFLYGNVLPDLATRFDAIPHYIEQSLQYISDAAAAMGERGEESSYSYSKNMGIITHYVSDYFCYPHTALFSGGLLRHMWYEIRMTLSVGKGRRTPVRLRRGECSVPSCDLKEKVVAMTNAYSRERSHCRHDIAYAIHSCSAIASGMVFESASSDSFAHAQHANA